MSYLKSSIEEIKKTKDVLIIGGGFIGVEFADELSKIDNLNVYLVEILPNLLANSFDMEFSAIAEEMLKSKGATILTGIGVEEIMGSDKVKRALLSDGTEIPVDSIILGVGGIPNTKLATDAGLDLGKGKGIWVDEYMRTIDPDIFAAGDCAGKRDFYTRKDAPVMLASTATAEARIAGANLYRLKVVRENKGTIAIYSTYIDGMVLGSAGLTENSARNEGFEIVTGTADGVDKHPPTLPGVSKVKVKLIFSKHNIFKTLWYYIGRTSSRRNVLRRDDKSYRGSYSKEDVVCRVGNITNGYSPLFNKCSNCLPDCISCSGCITENVTWHCVTRGNYERIGCYKRQRRNW